MGHQCLLKHNLLKTDFRPFPSPWHCNVCRESKQGYERWRCVGGCDYDVCYTCIESLIPNTRDEIYGRASGQAPTVLLGATAAASGRHISQSRIPHKHYVAYLDYRCNECGKSRREEYVDRFFCPHCSYDKCFACARSSGGDQEGLTIQMVDLEPFASGASRHAYKVMATKSDGWFDFAFII